MPQLRTLSRSQSLFSACLGERLERVNATFAHQLVHVRKCYRRMTIGLDNAVRDLFGGYQHLISGDQPHATDQRIHSDQRGGALQSLVQLIEVQVRRFLDELRIQILALRHVS